MDTKKRLWDNSAKVWELRGSGGGLFFNSKARHISVFPPPLFFLLLPSFSACSMAFFVDGWRCAGFAAGDGECFLGVGCFFFGVVVAGFGIGMITCGGCLGG